MGIIPYPGGLFLTSLHTPSAGTSAPNSGSRSRWALSSLYTLYQVGIICLFLIHLLPELGYAVCRDLAFLLGPILCTYFVAVYLLLFEERRKFFANASNP